MCHYRMNLCPIYLLKDTSLLHSEQFPKISHIHNIYFPPLSRFRTFHTCPHFFPHFCGNTSTRLDSTFAPTFSLRFSSRHPRKNATFLSLLSFNIFHGSHISLIHSCSYPSSISNVYLLYNKPSYPTVLPTNSPSLSPPRPRQIPVLR